MPRILAPHEIANYLGVGQADVAAWIREGSLRLVEGEDGEGIATDVLRAFLLKRLCDVFARRNADPAAIVTREVMTTLCAIERDMAGDGPPGTINVLVIDDSDTATRLLAEVVAQISPTIRVFKAADGLSACLELARRRIDLAIVDLLMPNLDGIALCRIIRQTVTLMNTRILVVSGLVGDDARRALGELGVPDAVEKPFRVIDLIETIRRLLRLPARVPQARG